MLCPGPEQQVSRRDRGPRVAGNVAVRARLGRERGGEHGGGEHEAGVHAGCTTRGASEVPANCASRGWVQMEAVVLTPLQIPV